ncbi:MAG: putative Ig domain-containing protein, partial [Methanomicrobiales archaeon]
TYTMTVVGTELAFDPYTLPAAVKGEAYNQLISVRGGISPVLVSETGTLPKGLSFERSGDKGLISGIPNDPAFEKTFPITISATDAYNVANSLQYSLIYRAYNVILSPDTETNLPDIYYNIPYQFMFSASGGTPPYTYYTAALPAGLVLSKDGMLSGTVKTDFGFYEFPVYATDANGVQGWGRYGLSFKEEKDTITVSPATIPAVNIGIPYKQVFTASGGTAPYTYLCDGLFPKGLQFYAGVLNGTSNDTSEIGKNFPIRVTARDSKGSGGYTDYTLIVKGNITISPEKLPELKLNEPFQQEFTATGGVQPYVFSEQGTLPTGMAFKSGVLSGTVKNTSEIGKSYPIKVTAKDSNGFTGDADYILKVNGSISISPEYLDVIQYQKPYKFSFIASGGKKPYTYQMSGYLPKGLLFNKNGVLSGTPTDKKDIGVKNQLTITAKDSTGVTGEKLYPYVVSNIAVTPDPEYVKDFIFEKDYIELFDATGGKEPIKWSSTGTLPEGITFDDGGTEGTPAIDGNPSDITQIGKTFSFKILAESSDGQIGWQDYSLLLKSASLTKTEPISVQETHIP